MDKSHRKLLFFTVLGSCLEFYDFAIYALFATYISQAFFPQHHTTLALINTFGIMAIGYLARPLGSIVFGHFGDKYGRKNTFSLTILLMSLSTLATGLIPNYSQIGYTAPFLLLLFRFIQGLSLGGETAGSSIFIAEHFSHKHRGLVVGMIFAGFTSGFIVSSLVAMFIHSQLSTEQIASFGWRIPFIFGCILGWLSYFIRKQVKESPIFLTQAAQQQQRFPLVTLIKTMPWRLIQGILLAAMISESVVVLLFIPSYLVHTHQISPDGQVQFTLLAAILLSLLTILFGGLSDIIGRKKLIITSALMVIIGGYPLFSHLEQINDHNIWLFAIIYVFLIAPANGTFGLKLMELFPTNIRYSGMALAYNLSFAIFGGTAPVLNSYLSKYHSQFSTYFFLALTAGLTLLAALCIKKDSTQINY